ncbi:hypothetical protein J53TS2_38640 [Paenibacillus sp. J53TS2]|nr:hypothetical protein J53TS2_38640 [Paenibacillus sp. J53TS2]
MAADSNENIDVNFIVRPVWSPGIYDIEIAMKYINLKQYKAS